MSARRVYLVDDHAILREGLRALLEAGGYVVVGEAADPATALRDILVLKPDIVLLDISLDGRSGFELLEAIHRRALPVRCLILTMLAQPSTVAEAMRLGAASYVLKGSSRAELLAAMDAVSHGRRYIGSAVAELAAQALATRDEADTLTTLSPRERQIIGLVVRGWTSVKIGRELHLSPKTVDTYRGRLMAKLGVGDVTGLVRFAIRTGLVDSSER